MLKAIRVELYPRTTNTEEKTENDIIRVSIKYAMKLHKHHQIRSYKSKKTTYEFMSDYPF